MKTVNKTKKRSHEFTFRWKSINNQLVAFCSPIRWSLLAVPLVSASLRASLLSSRFPPVIMNCNKATGITLLTNQTEDISNGVFQCTITRLSHDFPSQATFCFVLFLEFIMTLRVYSHAIRSLRLYLSIKMAYLFNSDSESSVDDLIEVVCQKNTAGVRLTLSQQPTSQK